MSNTAGIDHHKVCFTIHPSIREAELLKELPYLSAFVLVDFAAEGFNKKFFHKHNKEIRTKTLEIRLFYKKVAKETTICYNRIGRVIKQVYI